MKYDGETAYLVDASDPALSNWMRFVNCARSESEQNATAFQFEGQIYYRTCKNIYPGSELLVWYGKKYASKLGVRTDTDGESLSTVRALLMFYVWCPQMPVMVRICASRPCGLIIVATKMDFMAMYVPQKLLKHM